MKERSNNVVKDDAASPADMPERLDTLTGREQEILLLIGRGRANKEIAEQLAISVRTVEAHRARIMRKLGLHSHASLIYYALRSNVSNTP